VCGKLGRRAGVPRGRHSLLDLLSSEHVECGLHKVFETAHWSDLSLAGQRVIVVQAKAHRLGMYLMGQAVFTAQLVRKRFALRLRLSSMKRLRCCHQKRRSANCEIREMEEHLQAREKCNRICREAIEQSRIT
jgi:hypothetical protein